MSNVVLAIGGREYSMTCAAGEESHIADLGRMIDDKLGTLPDSGSQNDSRSLLFAALLLADEVFELRKSAPKLSAVSRPHAVPASGLSLDPAASPDQLVALAERLEAVVSALGIAA